MTILKRLLFALKFDIVPTFIIYSIPDQQAISFLHYEDARKYSDKQIEYNPKVMVEVKK